LFFKFNNNSILVRLFDIHCIFTCHWRVRFFATKEGLREIPSIFWTLSDISRIRPQFSEAINFINENFEKKMTNGWWVWVMKRAMWEQVFAYDVLKFENTMDLNLFFDGFRKIFFSPNESDNIYPNEALPHTYPSFIALSIFITLKIWNNRQLPCYYYLFILNFFFSFRDFIFYSFRLQIFLISTWWQTTIFWSNASDIINATITP